MTLLERKKLENILKRFNDEEMGGGFLYILYSRNKEEFLLQLDLCDYSSCIVCPTEQIKSIEFVEEDEDGNMVEGIYIQLNDDDFDSCWIDSMGVGF